MSATRRRCSRCSASAARPGRSTPSPSRITRATGSGAAPLSPRARSPPCSRALPNWGSCRAAMRCCPAISAKPVLLDIVTRVKQANPRALFACDPVMGDVGPGGYVRAGVPEFYRDHALAVADIVTPNRFELEWLTGNRVSNLAEAGAAAAMLRRQGPGIVLVTSLDLAPGRVAVVAAGPDGVWAVETPVLPIKATGCGDAVAALFLGWLLKGKPLPEALSLTIAAIYGVIEATMRNGSGELALVAAQDELVSPKRSVSLQQL